jgi:SNF2 family DNA or RNA helicase
MKRAVKWLVEHAAAGLFLDPGLGKTSITLAAITMLKEAGVLDRVLVVAPLRVCYLVWPAEMEKWNDFSHLRCAVLHGKDKTEAMLRRRDVDVFLINPEGLEWLLTKSRWKALGVDTLVLDESSKFKNSKTQRFKKLKPYLTRFRRRWILTGTPASNGLLDLFGQVYVMDTGRALGRFITHYRNKFFDRTGFGGFSWRVREGAEEEIYAALRPYVLRLSAEEYLTLPALTTINIKVQLPEKARRVYDEMEADLFSIVSGDRTLRAPNVASSVNKCRQIANGFAYWTDDTDPDDTRKRKMESVDIHDAKIEAVRELVDERNGKPTIVVYEFAEDLRRLRKEFGKDVPTLSGNMRQVAEVERAWNAGELPLLFLQPQSAGHGLNLQKAGDTMIWLSPIWDFELYDQTIKRIHRQGTKHQAIFVYHVVATDTVDEAVVVALKRKRNVQNRLFDALSTYRRSKGK